MLCAGMIQVFEQYARNLQNVWLVQCSMSQSRDGKFDIVDRLLPVGEACAQSVYM